VSGATSAHTKLHSPLSLSLIRALVLGTSIEGYARAALALASAEGREWSAVQAETLIVGGEEDYMCTKELCERLVGEIEGSRTVEMKGVGHWMAVEAPKRTADIMRDFFVVN
jgi:3-oxoadipate enol-lactonase